MASTLDNLTVFSDWAYKATTEVLAQQVDLFNAASQGTIVLQAASNTGDYNESAFWGSVSGLVRRRNAYGSGTVAEKNMVQLVDRTVKVAAGTPPVPFNPSDFAWINRSPEEAGVVFGQQLAKQTLADMLNTAIGASIAAMEQVSDIYYDAASTTDYSMSFENQVNTTAKFGDRSSSIAAWIMHSTQMVALYKNALANAEQLFTYGTVNVARDPFGRLYVITDCDNMVATETINSVSYTTYRTLGLVPGAITVDQNGDFTDNWESKNGDENIIRTYQAEWSYNLGVKGFAWDKTNGGKSPTTAALLTATNWDRYATSHKDLGGVLLRTR